MPCIPIDDAADPRLDDYRGLRDVPTRRVLERTRGIFVAEGGTVVARLAASRLRTRSVLVTPGRTSAVPVDDAVPVYVAPPDIVAAVVGFDMHRGVLAIGERPPPASPDTVLDGAGAVAVFVGINDHTNLGALFRAAAALGIDAVLLDPTCADPFYRRSVRVSMGGVFAVPFARLEPWPDAVEVLRARGFRVLAFSAAGKAGIDDLARSDRRRALVFGSEASGLEEAVLARADHTVRIPVTDAVDSLNVAQAAAIAFHRFGGLGSPNRTAR